MTRVAVRSCRRQAVSGTARNYKRRKRLRRFDALQRRSNLLPRDKRYYCGRRPVYYKRLWFIKQKMYMCIAPTEEHLKNRSTSTRLGYNFHHGDREKVPACNFWIIWINIVSNVLPLRSLSFVELKNAGGNWTGVLSATPYPIYSLTYALSLATFFFRKFSIPKW